MLLVTGKNGQLGQCLKEFLPDALYADVDALDITDENAVAAFIRENNVDTVVNAAGYTAVDKAEDDRDACFAVNAGAVRHLAQTGVRLVHVSTDYVFDGKNAVPYVETDKTAPLSVYGAAKLAGEKEALKASSAVVLRTSWLYSPFGGNFVKTMLRLGAERQTLSVVFDQIGTPTYAVDLARAIARLLPEITSGTKELFHFSNEGVASWYDFAVQIMESSGTKCRVLPIETAEYPTKAVRPAYSVLNKKKIKSVFGFDIPYWKESLNACLKRF